MKKLNFYTILLFNVLVLSACDKELSTPPPNAKVNGTAVIDAKSAQVTLNGVYYRFSNSTNTATDWKGYNMGPAQLTGMIGYQTGDAEPLENNINLAPNDVRYIPAYWTTCYQLLSAANGFIDGLNTLADAAFAIPARKTEMMSEARFLRAYAHTKLLLFFSEWKDLSSKEGVLLRTELGGVSTALKKRNTVAESYNSILEDLVLQQIEREKDLLYSSPKIRYERVLKRSPKLFQEIPNKYIANYLRMSPETLSRLKKS